MHILAYTIFAFEFQESNEGKRSMAVSTAMKEEIQKLLSEKVKRIKKKYVILSGKGGVGKSMVTANLAIASAMLGLQGKVGVLDIDIHGHSTPLYLGLEKTRLVMENGDILPAEGIFGIKVVSTAFMIEREDTPIIWRGPLKMKFIRDLLTRVRWGDLEVLFIDTPPGTGDELQAIVNTLDKLDGGIVVTTPADLSRHVVKRSVIFLEKRGVPAIGVIENMSYVVCPDGSVHDVFGEGGEKTAKELGLPLLARIPVVKELAEPPAEGKKPFIAENPNSEVARIFLELAKKLLGEPVQKASE